MPRVSVRWIRLIQQVDRRIHSPVYGDAEDPFLVTFRDPKAGMTEDRGQLFRIQAGGQHP